MSYTCFLHERNMSSWISLSCYNLALRTLLFTSLHFSFSFTWGRERKEEKDALVFVILGLRWWWIRADMRGTHVVFTGARLVSSHLSSWIIDPVLILMQSSLLLHSSSSIESFLSLILDQQGSKTFHYLCNKQRTVKPSPSSCLTQETLQRLKGWNSFAYSWQKYWSVKQKLRVVDSFFVVR